MQSKRIKIGDKMTLEEKYERWIAFAQTCHEQRNRIATLLRKPTGKKNKSVHEFDFANLLPVKHI